MRKKVWNVRYKLRFVCLRSQNYLFFLCWNFWLSCQIWVYISQFRIFFLEFRFISHNSELMFCEKIARRKSELWVKKLAWFSWYMKVIVQWVFVDESMDCFVVRHSEGLPAWAAVSSHHEDPVWGGVRGHDGSAGL